MMQRETRSLVVTGFLAVLLALIAAGTSPMDPRPEAAVAADPERYVPDAQFVQYLEYRAHLENSSNCQ